MKQLLVVLLACAGMSVVKAAGPANVPVGKYACYVFINGGLQGLANSDFEIKSGGVYLDNQNEKGTYAYDPAQSMLTFKGGSRNGQAALVEAPAGRRAAIRIYNEKRSRTVIDCENTGK